MRRFLCAVCVSYAFLILPEAICTGAGAAKRQVSRFLVTGWKRRAGRLEADWCPVASVFCVQSWKMAALFLLV